MSLEECAMGQLKYAGMGYGILAVYGKEE